MIWLLLLPCGGPTPSAPAGRWTGRFDDTSGGCTNGSVVLDLAEAWPGTSTDCTCSGTLTLQPG